MIIGIIWGLYIKNIALFIFVILLLIYLRKKLNIKIICIIIMIFFCIYSFLNENSYETLFNDIEEEEFVVEIISNVERKEYKNKYICKIVNLNSNKKYKNAKLILYLDKNKEYKYGDVLSVRGTFEYAKEASNYKGYNYRRLLWQKKIYGIIKSKDVNVVGNNNSINKLLNDIKIKLENNISKGIDDDKVKDFLIGLLLGDKSEISDEIIQNFRDASLSHILAISGFHIEFMISLLHYILRFLKNKRKKSIICIILIYIYICIIGENPACIRAFIMFVMHIIAQMLCRKSNSYNNLFFSLIVVLALNPLYVESVCVWLSFAGTLGIICINERINIKLKKRFYDFLFHNLLLSISVQIFILPILIYNYNTMSLTFFISNLVVGIFITPIIFLGFLILIFGKILFISNLEIFFTKIVFISAEIISNCTISKIYIKTPYFIFVIMYYVILFIIINRKKYFKYLKYCIYIIIIFSIILGASNCLNRKLKIYFVDVNQGDCTVIKTVKNKTLLIDGGESEYGKNTVLPYLLDRRINSLDYIIISHFDSDHVRTEF